MHRRQAGRPAFTLIELVVAMAIGVIVLILLWMLVSAMTKSFASSRDLLGSLQGAHLLVEYLKNDLAGCYYESGTRPVETSADFFDITFYVFDPEVNPSISLANPQGVLEKVNYHFDPRSNLVSRNGKPFTFAKFERVIFYFQPPDFEATPEKKFGNYVTLRVTCASEQVIEANRLRTDVDRLTKNVVTLITSVGIAQKAALEVWPGWNRPDEPTLTVR